MQARLGPIGVPTGKDARSRRCRYKEVAVANAQTAVLEREEDDPSAEAAPAPDSIAQLVVTQWLSEAVRSRLAAVSGLELDDDAGRFREAALIVVSTRIPAGASATVVSDIRAVSSCPIVAIVHPGGESLGAELIAAGASGLVAEGNEEAVATYLGGDGESSGLLDTFEQSLDKRAPGHRHATGDRDPVTRLRGAKALESRLAAAATSGAPRLAYARLLGLDDATRRLSVEARDLLRRRIALQCEQVCRSRDAEIFTTAAGEFVVLADHLAVVDFERLGRELIEVVHGYSPDRSTPLRLAVGHAGPEATSSIDSLRELALRGVEMAVTLNDGSIVGADRLTQSLAATTELDTMMHLITVVEQRDPSPGSHGDRVARTAVSLAEAMGLGARALVRLRLAARFHDVGKIDLDDASIAGDEESLSGEALLGYQAHPERGAAMLIAAAGREVAEAVSAHHERWDGSGFPEGLDGTSIPLAARIIAVADALDRWSVNGAAPERPTAAAIQRVTDGAGSRFDPAVVQACVEVFGTG
jgi:HD-GYP domain-containing protein (c-di-GMP phosphodiesterase class II)